MNRISIIILLFIFPFLGVCQEQQENNYRMRIAIGAKITNAKNEFKDHLKDSGFNDKFNSQFDAFRGSRNDFYPQSNAVPLFFEMSIDRKLSSNIWLGLKIGGETVESAEGYDRYGTGTGILGGTYSIGQFVLMEHDMWYFSPQLSINSNDQRIGLVIGPSIDFHALRLSWDELPEEKKHEILIGAQAMMSFMFARRLELVASYKLTNSLEFIQSTNSHTSGNSSTLPAKEFNFSNFRLGFAYHFFW